MTIERQLYWILIWSNCLYLSQYSFFCLRVTLYLDSVSRVHKAFCRLVWRIRDADLRASIATTL